MLKKKYRFVIGAFACVAILIVGNIFTLQTFKRSNLVDKLHRQIASPRTIDAKRGSILSSDGTVLATSVPVYNVYTDTRYIKDIDKTATVIADFFKIDKAELVKSISSNYYKEVVKSVSKEQIDEFAKIAPRGVGFYQLEKRVYSNNEVAGSVIGFTGNEGNGLAGLELSLNNYLVGKPGLNSNIKDKNGNSIDYNEKYVKSAVDGHDVTTTIDFDIQYKMYEEIKKAVETHKAKGGVAITMNPKTGEVLGIAEYPSLNPNNYKEYSNELYKSSAVSTTFEPGSTFKPITVAIAGATGNVDIEKEVFNDGGSYSIGKHVIGNWGNKAFGAQTAREILMNSSNVGTVGIAMKVPAEEFDNYQRKFGFGTKTGIELPGENNSVMFSKKQMESDINRATNSFGQGLAVTPMQLLGAWSTLINGGHSVNPHILKSVFTDNGSVLYSNKEKIEDTEEIIPKNISDSLRSMLKSVVDGGTGKAVQIPGYSVGGKTGTAQIVENGRYLPDKYKVSFIGFAPVEDPEFLTMVMVDQPQGKASGSLMAAPATKSILEYCLKSKGIKPITDVEVKEDEKSKEITVDSYQYRLRSHVENSDIPIPYEFEGDGEIVVSQNYVSTDGGVKLILKTDKLVKDNYFIMPNLVGDTVDKFVHEFGDLQSIFKISGDRTKPVSIQDIKAGQSVQLTETQVNLWTK